MRVRGYGISGVVYLFSTLPPPHCGSRYSTYWNTALSLLLSTRLCFHEPFIITARNSSCGKVMFSQVCIIPSVHGGRGSASGGGLPRGIVWGGLPGGGLPGGNLHPRRGLHRGGSASREGWADPPYTTGYGQRAGGTHYWNAFLFSGLQTWDVYWPAKMMDIDKIVMFHLQFWDAGENSLKKFDHIMPV